jgi:hypothetical protein
MILYQFPGADGLASVRAPRLRYGCVRRKPSERAVGEAGYFSVTRPMRSPSTLDLATSTIRITPS